MGRTKYQGLITFGHNNTDEYIVAAAGIKAGAREDVEVTGIGATPCRNETITAGPPDGHGFTSRAIGVEIFTIIMDKLLSIEPLMFMIQACIIHMQVTSPIYRTRSIIGFDLVKNRTI